MLILLPASSFLPLCPQRGETQRLKNVFLDHVCQVAILGWECCDAAAPQAGEAESGAPSPVIPTGTGNLFVGGRSELSELNP